MNGYDANGDVLPYDHLASLAAPPPRLAAREKIPTSSKTLELALACPACGRRLQEFRCKLHCSCGYHASQF